jgi:hypothetical protein
MNNDRLLKELDRLIAEGESVALTIQPAGKFQEDRAKIQPFAQWRAGAKNLMRMLGNLAAPWEGTFDGNNGITSVRNMLGTLQGIRKVIEAGALVSVEELVLATAFTDMLDQADYLLANQYLQAAGTLGRAVLESHLRSWAGNACAPITKARPTINDYKEALYRNHVIPLTLSKHIDAMAAIGNDAAHNKQGVKHEDVSRMLRDVREFITKYP